MTDIAEPAGLDLGRVIQETFAVLSRHLVTFLVLGLILVGIPKMGPENRNEAARFVTLIDALYEHRVKLLAAADAEPDALYPAGDGSFEFARTASRLHEMASDSYLAEGHGSG